MERTRHEERARHRAGGVRSNARREPEARSGLQAVRRASRAWRRLVSMLAVLACMWAAAPAMAQVETFVSNHEQTFAGTRTVGNVNGLQFSFAQQFTTGDVRDGYVFDRIHVRVTGLASPDRVDGRLYRDDAGSPGDLVAELREARSGTFVDGAGVMALLGPVGDDVTLAKSTKYWVVLENTSIEEGDANTYGVTYTSSPSEDTTTDWEIADTHARRVGDTSSWTTMVGGALLIEVRAESVRTVPDAPASFDIEPGDTKMRLTWTASGYDGASPITDYEYRYAKGATVPDSTPWTSAGTEGRALVSGLDNGNEYAFELRAVNAEGGSTPTTARATPQVRACNAPDVAGKRVFWNETLTVGRSLRGWGFLGGGIGTLDGGPFAIGSREQRVWVVLADNDGTLNVQLEYELNIGQKKQMVLYVCDEAFAVDDAEFANIGSTYNYLWPGEQDWELLATRQLRLVGPANRSTTGEVRIATQVGVGTVMRVDTSDLHDPDGLSAAIFDYQWLRSRTEDGTETTEAIEGATERTYTAYSDPPEGADPRSTRYSVRVGVTDDFGTRSLKTSAKTEFVAPYRVCPNNDWTDKLYVWQGTIEVGNGTFAGAASYGWLRSGSTAFGWLTSDRRAMFDEYLSASNEARGVLVGQSNGKLTLAMRRAFSEEDREDLTLYVCGRTFKLKDATTNSATEYRYEWTDTGLDWKRVPVPLPAGQSIQRRVALAMEPYPSIESAAVGGTNLQLAYNQALDETSVPAVSAFTVMVGGTAATVDAVGIEGRLVTLELATAVAANASVTVSYTRPSSNLLKNIAGVKARAVRNHQVLQIAIVGEPFDAAVGAPTEVKMRLRGDAVELRWLPRPVDQAQHSLARYDIRYRRTGTTDWTASLRNLFPSGSLPYRTHDMAGTLVRGREYELQVRALTPDGVSRWSESATVNLAAPERPAGLTAEAVTGRPGHLRLAITPASGGGTVTDYEARYRVTSRPGQWREWSFNANGIPGFFPNAGIPVELGTGEDAPHIFFLKANTRYTVQVRAANIYGRSAWSSNATATTASASTGDDTGTADADDMSGDPKVPSRPTVKRVANVGGSLMVRWHAPRNPDGTVTGYMVAIAPDTYHSAPTRLIEVNERDGGVPRTYRHVTGLKNATTYRVWVRARIRSAGYTGNSPPQTGTTREAGGATNDIKLSLEYPDGSRAKTASRGETVRFRLRVKGINDATTIGGGITMAAYKLKEQGVFIPYVNIAQAVIPRFFTFTGNTEGYIEWDVTVPSNQRRGGFAGESGHLEIALDPYRASCTRSTPGGCTLHPVESGKGSLCLAVEHSGSIAHPCPASQEAEPEPAPAQIVRGPTISDPGSDGAWTDGETVTITVGFDQAVDVDTTEGTPAISLRLGGSAERSAPFTGGSGTDELTFSYTLGKSDGRQTSMMVPANAISLNAGTIRNAGSAVDAVLDHNGAVSAGHGGRGTRESEEGRLTASFENVPESHDGSSEFTVRLVFSEPPPLSYTTVRDSLLEVTGGAVTEARRTTSGSDRSWEVTIVPAGASQAAEIVLPVRACGPANAICIGGRALAQAARATVSPPPPLTATLGGVPREHDGRTGFELEVEFSEPPSISYRTVRDRMFTVSGGSITGARRSTRGSNLRFIITVAPSGYAPVGLSLNDLPACGEAHSICTEDGRALVGPLSATVLGPAALSVADASVAEGPNAKLEFAVTLDRERHAAVTVDLRDFGRHRDGTGGLHRRLGHAHLRRRRDQQDGRGDSARRRARRRQRDDEARGSRTRRGRGSTTAKGSGASRTPIRCRRRGWCASGAPSEVTWSKASPSGSKAEAART